MKRQAFMFADGIIRVSKLCRPNAM